MKNDFDKKEYNEQYFKERPWLRCFYNAKRRCNKDGEKYKAKGIGFYITKEEIEMLWVICHADLMDKPSLDRKDPTKGYHIWNCRFIELRENRLQGIIGRKYTDEQKKRISESNKRTKKANPVIRKRNKNGTFAKN